MEMVLVDRNPGILRMGKNLTFGCGCITTEKPWQKLRNHHEDDVKAFIEYFWCD